MGTALGIAGFTLLWVSTCLTEASLPQIAGTAAAGLALMALGKLWAPCMGWIKERKRRRPMPAPAGSSSRTKASGTQALAARGDAGMRRTHHRLRRHADGAQEQRRRGRG